MAEENKEKEASGYERFGDASEKKSFEFDDVSDSYNTRSGRYKEQREEFNESDRAGANIRNSIRHPISALRESIRRNGVLGMLGKIWIGITVVLMEPFYLVGGAARALILGDEGPIGKNSRDYENPAKNTHFYSKVYEQDPPKDKSAQNRDLHNEKNEEKESEKQADAEKEKEGKDQAKAEYSTENEKKEEMISPEAYNDEYYFKSVRPILASCGFMVFERLEKDTCAITSQHPDEKGTNIMFADFNPARLSRKDLVSQNAENLAKALNAVEGASKYAWGDLPPEEARRNAIAAAVLNLRMKFYQKKGFGVASQAYAGDFKAEKQFYKNPVTGLPLTEAEKKDGAYCIFCKDGQDRWLPLSMGYMHDRSNLARTDGIMEAVSKVNSDPEFKDVGFGKDLNLANVWVSAIDRSPETAKNIKLYNQAETATRDNILNEATRGYTGKPYSYQPDYEPSEYDTSQYEEPDYNQYMENMQAAYNDYYGYQDALQSQPAYEQPASETGEHIQEQSTRNGSADAPSGDETPSDEPEL